MSGCRKKTCCGNGPLHRGGGVPRKSATGNNAPVLYVHRLIIFNKYFFIMNEQVLTGVCRLSDDSFLFQMLNTHFISVCLLFCVVPLLF